MRMAHIKKYLHIANVDWALVRKEPYPLLLGMPFTSTTMKKQYEDIFKNVSSSSTTSPKHKTLTWKNKHTYVHHCILYNIQDMGTTQMFKYKLIYKLVMVYIQIEYYVFPRKNKILPFAVRRIEVEDIMLKSVRVKGIDTDDFTNMWYLNIYRQQQI